MGKQVKVSFQGREHEGEELEFTTEKDAWVVVKVEDGTTLKIKPAVTRIVRAKDYIPQTGEPLYIVNSTLLLSQDVPDTLKEKTKT